MRANGDGVGRRPVADGRARQHPYPVLRVAFELVKQKVSIVQFDDGGLAVRSAGLHDLQLVVNDIAVAALGRRWLPRHPYRGRTYRFSTHVAGWRSRYYGGVSRFSERYATQP